MQLTNKRVYYNVDNVKNLLKITGSFTVVDTRITDFYCNVFDVTGSDTNVDIVQNGSCTYYENTDGTISKSVNSVTPDKEAGISVLLDETIAAVKTELKL